MVLERKLTRIAGIFVVVVAISAFAGFLVFRSSSFQRYIRGEIEKQASEATGAHIEIQALNLHLWSLRAEACGITVYGNEVAGVRPLAHADRLLVGLNFASLLHRELNLKEIVLIHPVVSVVIDKIGNSNLPVAPKSRSGSSSNIFDLGIQHVLLDNGEIYYNDVKTPLNADLRNLHLEVRSELGTKTYNGTIAYGDGHVQYGKTKALPHDLRAEFQATPSEFALRNLVLRVASTTLQFQGRVQDYFQPVINGSYRIVVHPEQMRPIVESVAAGNLDYLPAGELVVVGSINYQQKDDVPLLRSLVVDGQLMSNRLGIDNEDVQSELRRATGKFRLADGELTIPTFEVDVLGGHLSARAVLRNIDSPEKLAGNAHASLHSVSLDEINAAAKSANLKQMPINGSLSGTAEAIWTAGAKTTKARSDLVLKAALTSASSGSKPLPLDGELHVAYDGRSRIATLTDTHLGTAKTRIDLKGVAGSHINLNLHAHAADLRELDSLAASLHQGGESKTIEPARRKSIDLGGIADLQLNVTGSGDDPRISGELSGQDLQVENTQWRKLTAGLRAGKNSVSLEHGTLVNAQQGYIKFSGSSGLSAWHYLPSSPIKLEVNSQGLPIDSLLRIARVDYPIQGNLSVTLTLHGSQMNPQGNGSIRLIHAKVYGQPLDQAEVHFNGDGNILASSLELATSAGSAKAHLEYHPKTQGYELQLDAPAIQLAQIQPLQERNIGIAGVLALSANGKGTVADPQLTSTVQIPELRIRDTSVSGIKASLGVSNHKANLTLDSQLLQTLLQARATLDLNGEHNLHANIDTKGIPIEGLLALYAPAKSNGPHGIVEVHALVDGPLGDRNRIKARLIVPTLKLDYQELQIGNAKPVQVDYANSIIEVRPTEFTGTDTDVRLQGQVPLQGDAPATLAANGSVNLRLLQFFQHDLQSSGKLQLDLHATGAASHPSVQGRIRLQNAAVNSPDAPVGIQNVNAVLDVANDRINISELTGEAGGGQITAHGAIGYRPQVQMNVAMQAKNVRVRYQDQIRTVFDGNLDLVGTTQAATASGRVLVNSLSFTPNFDLATLAGQVQSGPESTPTSGTMNNVKLNITVQTSREMNLSSTAVSLQGQANLRVIGTMADPVIVGKTEFTGGDIFLMNQRYRIERGIIQFSNPHRTEPVLNVLLTSTISQYNLSLTFRGPLDKLQTNYVSDPPLPTADIVNLIARGQTTEQAAASPTNLGATSLLAQGAASQVSGQIQKLTGLSSLSIDPTLGGNNADPTARIAMQKRITNNLLFTFATDVTSAQREIIQGEYRINKGWSASVTRDENGGFAVDGKYHKRF